MVWKRRDRPHASGLKPDRTLRTQVPSADGEGFEPPGPQGPFAFETSAFSHSANHP